MRTTVRTVTGLGMVLLAGGIACGGGGDGGGGGGGPDVTIAKAAVPNGDAQTATVAAALTDSLVVIVEEDGVPKAGVTVTWTAQATGATVSPTTSVTDVNGHAATRLTLGTGAGAQTARAALAGAIGSPVTFNATATAGPATSFTIVAGNGQTAAVNTAFATPLSVKVGDQYGNGIAGVTVTWAVQSGNLTLGGPTSVTAATGLATKAVVAAATLGAAVVRATNPSVAGDLDFNLTVEVAPVEVRFGNTFFESLRNGSTDPAVDTATVGRTVRWTNTGGGTHTVQSINAPSFASSGNLVDGAVYTVTFNTVGSYQYNCSIHGSDMTGRIVVIP